MNRSMFTIITLLVLLFLTPVWDTAQGSQLVNQVPPQKIVRSAPDPTVIQICSSHSQGDADCDGQVNLVDYDYYRRTMLLDSVPAFVNTDFNGDGETGTKDGKILATTLGFPVSESNNYNSTCPLKSQGDADCDGQVNLVDYDYYSKIALFASGIPNGINADFSGDNEVGVKDGKIVESTLSDNMAPNPSFEQADSNDSTRPASWSPKCSGSDAWDAATAHGGTHSVSVVPSSQCGWWTTVTIPNPPPDYTLSVWKKGGTNCEIGYQGFDANGSPTTDTFVTTNSNPSNWVKAVVSIPLSQLAKPTRTLKITLGGCFLNATVRWDDVELLPTNITPPPVAEFDAWPPSGNAPLIVTMHSNASGTITSCTWDYGDGTTGNSCTDYHDHTYTTAGSYSVSLTVAGPGGSDTRTRSNYINVSPPLTYSASGRVTNVNNIDISGVTITTTGPTNKSATTDSNGNYTLTGLAAGNYTITPSKSGYTFSPPSRPVNVPPNATMVNFTGSLLIDLEATTIQTPSPSICTGSSPEFVASTRNNGSAASGIFNFRWDADGQPFYGEHGSISPGTYQENGHIWQNIPQGQHTLIYTADYDNQIAESNENNNQKTIAFTAVNCAPDTTPPAAVTNLASVPDLINPGQVKLSWTAPGDDGSGGGPATRYDIRYSSTPINESNWENATQIYSGPPPNSPGSPEQRSLPLSFVTGTRWYFAMKTVDEVNNRSGLSNVPSLQEIGFRPNPQGYKFSNGNPEWGLYPNSPANGDYTINDLRQMFGNSAVCWMVGSTCYVNPLASLWNDKLNQKMNGGHCDGMASTTLLFFKSRGRKQPSQLQQGASIAHDLDLVNARQNIAYYHVEQATNPIKEYTKQVRQNTPSAILNQLRSAMSGNLDTLDPVTLSIYKGREGHTITPYAIQERGNGVWWVWVYDNNYSDDSNRYVVIDTNANTWSYDLGSNVGKWGGDANTHTLGITPISKYIAQPVCPWCIAAGALSGTLEGQVSLNGQGHLLITDSTGRRIGYMGNQFVNQIPGAYESIISGGLGIEMEPLYTIPLVGTYTILLDGQIITQTSIVGVVQFGPGYAVSVEAVSLKPSSKDQVTIAPDGTQLTYRASETKSPTLILARNSANESYQFEIIGADISGGKVVALTVNSAQGRISFSNANASGGIYDLRIKRVSTSGIQTFIHTNITISVGNTHYVNYGTWNGTDSMTLQIDYNSDGTIDQTTILENQVPRVYLPMILRN